jgi:predicted acyl esterase
MARGLHVVSALATSFALMPVTVYAERVESGVPGMVFEHGVPVTMTDGLALRINIYRPDKEGRFPVVMLHGPYGKDTRDADSPAFRDAWAKLTARSPDLCKRSSCRYIRWEAPDPERWVPDGYVVIHADSRGSNASPGVIDPFSARQTEDYATLITWASRQPWSSGKVGLLGISYYAINQWQVGARQPEGLAAIIPWEGAYDYYRDIAQHGGIRSTQFPKAWFARQVAVNQHGHGGTPYIDAITGERTTGKPLPPHVLKLNRVEPADEHARQPYDGAYYAERTPMGSRITVPLLSVGNWGGLGLHGRGNIEGYLAAASRMKWLRVHMGNHHARFYTEESLALQKRFFDRFLKGESNGFENEPPISLAIRRPDGVTWRKETEWPLKGTEWQRYYLDADARELASTPTPARSEVVYAALGEGVTFRTVAFADETEFTGPMKLKLWVKSSTADMDIFATLRLIDPAGRDVTFEGASEPNAPVTQGWLRVSHRALDPERSTEYRPYHLHRTSEPMTPGTLHETDVEIWPSSIVVPRGYRLALTVQGKDWENPGASGLLRGSGPFIHGERDPALYGGTNAIASGEGQASYLLLPHIPRNR